MAVADAAASRQPLIGIWIASRAAIRRVIEHGSLAVYFALATVWGIWKNLDQILRHALHENGPGIGTMLLGNVAFGAPYGIVVLFLGAALIKGVAHMFKVPIAIRSVCLVVALAATPQILSLCAWCLAVLMTGDALIYGSARAPSELAGSVVCVERVYRVFSIIMAFWSMVIVVVGLSEAARITLARSLGVLVVSAAIYFALLLGLVLAAVG